MKSTINTILTITIIGVFSFLFVACDTLLIVDVPEHTDGKTDDTPLIGGSVDFSQSGPVGGGYPNVVSWDPNVPGKIYYGADIGGTGRSTNYGKDFEAAAQGLGYQDSHTKIAAINAVDVDGNTVIVGGTGFKGKNGEIISSTDGGDFWMHDSSDISFSAQNSNAPLPKGRPRSTDPSLIQWVGGSVWVAGTYDKGLWLSTDDRANWKRLNVFEGDVFVRAMAMSPNEPNTLYVGLWGDNVSIPNKGLWKVNLVNGRPTATQMSDIPDVVESIVVLDDRMYLACGRFGVRRLEPSKNDKVTDISCPIGHDVMATAVHGATGKSRFDDRVVVGTAKGEGNVFISDDGGSTWANTTSSGVAISPWGGGEDLLVFKKHPNWALGESKCDIATIQISPHDPNAWVVCSTSAIWTTDDAGTTWRPANGFQILSYRDVEIGASNLIAAGNVDHDVLVSDNAGSKWTTIGLGGVTVAHALAFSPDGAELAFSNNERDNNKSAAKLGMLSSAGTPLIPGLIEIDYPASPKRIVGMTWLELPDGSNRLVTAVDNGGIKTIDRINGVWSGWNTRSTEFMGAQANGGLRCSVVSNDGSTVFIYDRETGVWRSTDYGENWSLIHPDTAGKDKGYLAYDGSNDKLYVSTDKEVLRFDDASNSDMSINLSFPTGQPGAMSLDPQGRLWVFSKPLGAGSPVCNLYRADNPETDTIVWDDVADDNFRRVAPLVIDMEVSENLIVLVTSGKGMLVSPNAIE